jgi:hypothetical protein
LGVGARLDHQLLQLLSLPEHLLARHGIEQL